MSSIALVKAACTLFPFPMVLSGTSVFIDNITKEGDLS